VASARQRTWYAGALPVSLAEFTARSTGATAQPMASAETFRAALGDVDIAQEAADAIGPAIAAATAVCIEGVAPDEHQAVAEALGRGLVGTTVLPYALFAAGAVIRCFDPTLHHLVDDPSRDDGGLDILRSSRDATQWTTVIRPSVILTGGILASDVVPAYDEDARFYVQPAPLAAAGGLLSVTDAATNPRALIDLARLWLIPGRHHTGIILLRSGERIEVPWRTGTALIGVAPDRLPEPARGAVTCWIDVGALSDEALPRFLGRRLDDAAFPGHVPGELASRIASAGLGRRSAAAAACSYLRDRAAYEGAAFSLTDQVLSAAIAFARTNASGAPTARGLRAA
jgi:hypothetical protein